MLRKPPGFIELPSAQYYSLLGHLNRFAAANILRECSPYAAHKTE